MIILKKNLISIGLYFIFLTGISYSESCNKYFPMPVMNSLTVVVPLCNLPKEGIYYGDFAITTLRYNAKSNWNTIIQNIFGSNYRVADWNDLEKFYYENNGDLLNLFNGLNLKKYTESAFVTYNGEKQWPDQVDRFYYAVRLEHNLPDNFLSHDNIDNDLINLGSWFVPKKIMAVKKTFK